jgi:hypothetical protein
MRQAILTLTAVISLLSLHSHNWYGYQDKVKTGKKDVSCLDNAYLFGSTLKAPDKETPPGKANLHLVTARGNQLPGFPFFHFKINGQSYKLSNGECLEKTLLADSLHVVVEDKRWVKKETEDLHIPVDSLDIYIWVRVTWTGNYKNPRYGAEVVCKSCYEEIKAKCKKTIVE